MLQEHAGLANMLQKHVSYAAYLPNITVLTLSATLITALTTILSHPRAILALSTAGPVGAFHMVITALVGGNCHKQTD